MIGNYPLAQNLPVQLPLWQDCRDGVHQRLVQSWTWLGITIPAGFLSDGASVPWWARWALPKRGIYVFAAYLHDYLLTVTTRKRAAMKFLYAMKVLGVPKWKRRLMFQGVRTHDWWHYGG